ncbi:hypothetical protein HPB49_017771 [Dermacentor silvarum]|uniref:Uncharacterized protein n=1 Tax=Dermacentor silvarum TaxID=543639 RepID=A0ACB8CAR7_DERSI|nr:hypothetical protein HPB49_017771 [Dermacentor silvarum]
MHHGNYDFLDWLEACKENKNGRLHTVRRPTAPLARTTHALVEISMYCFMMSPLCISCHLVNTEQILKNALGSTGRWLDYLSGSCTKAKINCACKEGCCRVAHKDERHPDDDQGWEEFRKGASIPRTKGNLAVTVQARFKANADHSFCGVVYAVNMTLKKLKCDKFENALIVNNTIIVSPALPLCIYSLTKEIDRGDDVYLATSAVNADAQDYVVVEQLAKETRFFSRARKKREIVKDLAVHLLAD